MANNQQLMIPASKELALPNPNQLALISNQCNQYVNAQKRLAFTMNSVKVSTTNVININNKLTSEVKKSSGVMSKFAGVVQKVKSFGIDKLKSGLIQAGKDGIKYAADLEKTQNVVSSVFGNNTSDVNSWAENAKKSFGLSKLQAENYSSSLGGIFKSSGLTGNQMTNMSEKLTELTGNFASFYNIADDDAFSTIRDGISGDAGELQKLGINMSDANLKAYALSKGMQTSYDDMSDAEKMTLRYNYLMDNTKDVQGDFTKNQKGFSNQLKLVKLNFQELAGKIMKNVLPALTYLIERGNKFLESIDTDKISAIAKIGFKFLGDAINFVKDRFNEVLPIALNLLSSIDVDKIGAIAKYGFEILGNAINFVKDNINIILPIAAGLAATFGTFFVISKITEMIKGFKTALTVATTASKVFMLALSTNPLGIVAIAIGTLVGVFVAAYMNSEKFRTGVSNLISKIKEIVNVIKSSGVGKILSSIGSAAGKLFGGGGSNSSSEGVPKFATGGIATQPSIFGEAGPEMAIPLKRTPRNLGLLGQTARILGVTGGSNESASTGVSINFAPVYYGANKDDVSSEFEKQKSELLEIIEGYFKDKERVAFG